LTIKCSVTDAFGKVWASSVGGLDCYSDFIDTDTNGVDDRANDTYFEHYEDGAGNTPNVNTAVDLGAMLGSLKGFFGSLYGIIPEQVFVLIMGGMILLITIGLLRAVLH